MLNCEHGKPSLDGVDRDPEVPSDVREVQELRTPGRQDAEEIPVSGQVADLPERAQIPFETGLDVAGVPDRAAP